MILIQKSLDLIEHFCTGDNSSANEDELKDACRAIRAYIHDLEIILSGRTFFHDNATVFENLDCQGIIGEVGKSEGEK